jgi:hypothetical protein
MRVIVAPVVVNDRVCRIVSPVDSLLEVEEWVGEWWEPSAVPLTTVSLAEAAPQSMLLDLGIPASDWFAIDLRPAQGDIEASMQTLNSERPAEMRMEDEVVRRGAAPKRRAYPGNSRFRRGGASSAESPALPPSSESRAD